MIITIRLRCEAIKKKRRYYASQKRLSIETWHGQERSNVRCINGRRITRVEGAHNHFKRDELFAKTILTSGERD